MKLSSLREELRRSAAAPCWLAAEFLISPSCWHRGRSQSKNYAVPEQPERRKKNYLMLTTFEERKTNGAAAGADVSVCREIG